MTYDLAKKLSMKYDFPIVLGLGMILVKKKYEVWFGQKIKYEVWVGPKTFITMLLSLMAQI